MIRNPILPGSKPDPGVGDDYYIATSTFEWYPGSRYTIRGTSRIGGCVQHVCPKDGRCEAV